MAAFLFYKVFYVGKKYGIIGALSEVFDKLSAQGG